MSVADRIFNWFGLLEEERRVDEEVEAAKVLRRKKQESLDSVRVKIEKARKNIHRAIEDRDDEKKQRQRGAQAGSPTGTIESFAR